MEFIKQTFSYNNISIEVNVSTEDKSIWLSQKDMTILYGYAKATISKWVVVLFKEQSKSTEMTSKSTFRRFAFSDINGKSDKPIYHYNLPLILEVGRRLKSPIVNIFESWCNDILNPQIIESPSNIIKFDNGIISLDVRVEPSEKEVYLSQNQIAILFGTSQPNISMHITNIMDEGELDFDSVHKDFLYTAQDGKQYLVTYYNLDVILAVGYRVKSNEARQFRRWASNILESYLNNGYLLDKDILINRDECFFDLKREVIDINKRLVNVEEYIKESTLEEEIILEDMEHNFITLLSKLIRTTTSSIVMMDPYVSKKTLVLLENKKREVKVLIYTSSKARIKEDDIISFNNTYGGLIVKIDDRYHDRFLIIDDNDYYHFGASFDEGGKRLTRISKISRRENQEILDSRIE